MLKLNYMFYKIIVCTIIVMSYVLHNYVCQLIWMVDILLISLIFNYLPCCLVIVVDSNFLINMNNTSYYCLNNFLHCCQVPYIFRLMYNFNQGSIVFCLFYLHVVFPSWVIICPMIFRFEAVCIGHLTESQCCSGLMGL